LVALLLLDALLLLLLDALLLLLLEDLLEALLLVVFFAESVQLVSFE